MAHEYAKEAKESHEKKLKSYGAKTSSTADKLDDKDDATNWAGFRALNTNKQAGMAPLNKKATMSEETNPRIMRKKGGRVHGAESLKRLDKAPRKGKAAGGQTGNRVGQIPSADTQQQQFDATTRVKPGTQPQGVTRAKGGRIAKAYGGSRSGDPLTGFLDQIFGDAAPEAAAPAAPAARHAPAAHRGRKETHTHTIEHPPASADYSAPIPPSRPASITDVNPNAGMGMPAEGGMRSFLEGQGMGARPAPVSADSSTANPFFARELYNRKDGGRLVRKSGGSSFEGSAKDEREDKKLAKKHHMSFDQWEKSPMDRKHDEQESMKGLKKGGRAKRADGGGAFDDYMGGSSGGSSRKGSSGKGRTTVNIMIGAQPQPSMATPQGAGAGVDPALLEAIMGGAGGPPQQLPPTPPPGGAGGAPAPAPMMAAPPPSPMPPPGPGPGAGGPPMMRKDGGKVQVPYRKPSRKGDYPAMDFGSGGGFGRKQKIDSYGTKGPNSKNNY